MDSFLPLDLNGTP